MEETPKEANRKNLAIKIDESSLEAIEKSNAVDLSIAYQSPVPGIGNMESKFEQVLAQFINQFKYYINLSIQLFLLSAPRMNDSASAHTERALVNIPPPSNEKNYQAYKTDSRARI